MEEKNENRKIDLERAILVPVFLFLLLANIGGVYSSLAKDFILNVTFILHIVHSGLLVCFYVLLITLFFIRYQAKATSRSIVANMLAYVGTFTPFLLIFFGKPETGTNLMLLSICIMLAGLLFVVYALKILGRSFGIMPQARALVQNGPYRFIRHPLYVGEIVTFGGTLLAELTLAKLGIYIFFIAVQSYRAIQEEKLLEKTIPEYSIYMAATKRFIPWVI